MRIDTDHSETATAGGLIELAAVRRKMEEPVPVRPEWFNPRHRRGSFIKRRTDLYFNYPHGEDDEEDPPARWPRLAQLIANTLQGKLKVVSPTPIWVEDFLIFLKRDVLRYADVYPTRPDIAYADQRRALYIIERGSHAAAAGWLVWLFERDPSLYAAYRQHREGLRALVGDKKLKGIQAQAALLACQLAFITTHTKALYGEPDHFDQLEDVGKSSWRLPTIRGRGRLWKLLLPPIETLGL